MALPQGPADGSLPTGDPSPSEGTPGPSQAPANPAATRRRALLQELETQVQAAYGQVKGAGVWSHPQLGDRERTVGMPHPNRGPLDQPRAEPREGTLDVHSDGGVSSHSAVQEGGWHPSPPLPSLRPASSPQSPKSAALGSLPKYKGQGAGPGRCAEQAGWVDALG